MTLKLSWESLKCQILLSLIHSNLGCTFYCAANLEIHDKSLFQSFLRIIFAKPGWKDPHDYVFIIVGCGSVVLWLVLFSLSAYGCMKVVLEMSKLWYNKLNKTTRLKTKNIKFPPLYFTEIEFDVRWGEGVAEPWFISISATFVPETHLGQIKRNSVISSTSRDWDHWRHCTVLVPIKVIKATPAAVSLLSSLINL